MFDEDQLEEMTMDLLLELGYDCKNGYELDRDFHSVFDEDVLYLYIK